MPLRLNLFLILIAAATASLPAQAAALEFFEQQVRPLLADRCFRCHGPTKQESDLRLDHITHLRTGGTRGPALNPDRPGSSLILQAIGYEDPHLQMPPKRRLSATEQQTLRRWIEMGAPWPGEPPPTARRPKATFDLAGRRAAHWAWHPMTRPTPPAVAEPRWRPNPVDRFVHAAREARGLRTARPADPLTLLRRVTFDLTGLPPSPQALQAFAADSSDVAYEAVVDALLASPRFGEHWARHWMDLVRYAETLGHEFDYELPNAWRYRDYLIRAFNGDVPYGQFVREHIAGDLLERPRRHPTDGANESIIGTAFYWFGDQTHSPVDVRKATADRTDGQIDVLSKTFLGLTVSCARCHDHKFDAISTEDYYALSGFLKSSRYMQRAIRPRVDADAVAAMRRVDRRLQKAWAARIREQGPEILQRLAQAMAPEGASPALVFADLPELDEARKKRFAEAGKDRGIQREKTHPLYGFARLLKPAPDALTAWRRALESPPAEDPTAITLVDFRPATASFADWFQEGTAFGPTPLRTPSMVHSDRFPTAVHAGGYAHSGARGLQAQGVLHSPRFALQRRYLHVLAHGREGRVRVVLEGFHLIRNPIYGTLHQEVNSTLPRWYTVDLTMWPGRRGYLEICDQTVHELALGKSYRDGGYVAVQRAVLSDRRAPPPLAPGLADTVLVHRDPKHAADGEPATDPMPGFHAYTKSLLHAADQLAAGQVDDTSARLLNWLWAKQLLLGSPEIDRLRQEMFRLQKRAAPPTAFVPAMADGNGEAEHIFLRGSHASPGRLAPRRFLTALAGDAPPILSSRTSGRLTLADQIAATDNPLTYRVWVNRIWHHLFGRGLVPTVDNFGVQGQPPSHPALLDWLAQQFLADGQSLKATVRRLVLSRTYRLSSRGDPEAERADPENRWLHRARVRRLSGEALRDAMLAISGALKTKPFGPSTPTHLTRFMTGRGRPRSGPLDGAGRRSIYIRVSRNFLSPFFLAFDTPLPAAPMGRRVITNVPAQALALLNDPFVHAQADRWAQRLLEEQKTPAQRIDHAFRQAFGRPPRPDEVRRVEGFLASRGTRPDGPSWADLCHALLNVKEFAFLR